MATLEELRARVEPPVATAAPVSLEDLRARTAMTGGPPIPEPVPMPRTLRQRAGEVVRPIAARTMALGEGATLGAAPELVAGATSGLAMMGLPGFENVPQDPSQNLARIESIIGELPMAERIGYGIAGGLGTGIGLARALPVAYATIPRAAGTTAAEGAFAGAFSAPEGHRTQGALAGGALGGLFGLGVPALTRGIRNWYQSAKGGLNAQQRAGIREALTALERDEIAPEQFFARAKRIPGYTMMDMPFARNVQGLARGRVESLSGPGQRLLTRTLQQRARGQRQRIGESIRRVIGAEDFGQFQEDLIAQRRAAAKDLYDTALQRETIGSEALDRMRDLDFVKDAEKTVRANFPDLKEAAPDSMALWDQIYKEMGAKAQSISNPNRGYAYSDVMRRLREAVTDANPDYGLALERFAGDKALEEALDQGRRVLKDDDFMTARFIRNLTEGERESYLVGVARGVQDMVDRGNLRSNISERLLQPATQRKLRAALGSTKAARQFVRDALREATFARTKQAVVGGSPTARIQAEQAPVTASMIDPAIQAAQGDMGQATMTGLRRIVQGLGAGRGIQPERQDTIARLLLGLDLPTRSGPVPAPAALAGPQAQRAIAGETAAQIGTAGVAGAGMLAGTKKNRRRFP